MSEGEAPAGLTFLEKFFGVLLIVFGAILLYYMQQTPTLKGTGFIFFPIFAIGLIVLGVFMVLAKAE
jgi:hypothetical protein